MIPKIEDLMSEGIYSIDSKKSVQEGAEKMAHHKTGSLLVTHEEEYIGIVTEVDITRKVVAKKRRPADVMIEEVMAAPLITVDAGQSIVEANDLMESRQLRHLPVRRDGKIVGIVSVRDLLHPIYLDEEEDDERMIEAASGY